MGELLQISVKDLVRDYGDQVVPWVADGVAAAGCLTVLAGRPGEGKSWLALGLGKGCEGGEVIAGIPCKYGRTLYLDAENGPREMGRRAKGLRIGWGVEFLFPRGAWDLESGIAGLAHLISYESPNLVILDGFRSLWNGDENDSRAVTHILTALTKLAEEFNVAIVLLHHMSKTGGYRGTGAIAAVPQIVIEIEADGPIRTMRWEKCRVGPAPYMHKFRIEGGADSVQLLAA